MSLASSANSPLAGVPVVTEASAWSSDPTGSLAGTKSPSTPTHFINIQSDLPLSDYRLAAPDVSTPVTTLADMGDQDDQYLKTKSHEARIVA